MTEDAPKRRGFGPILLQVAGVVFAVLIALAVDEAWESRENQELGREADGRVLAEISQNRDEVMSSAEENRALMVRVQDLLGTTADTVTLDVQYSFSLLSSAAWEAAGLTGAIRFMDFERVSSFSRLYGLQALYHERQLGMVDVVAGLSSMALEESPVASAGDIARIVARRTLGPLAVAGSLEEALLLAYDSVLVELGVESR